MTDEFAEGMGALECARALVIAHLNNDQDEIYALFTPPPRADPEGAVMLIAAWSRSAR